ncbi:MAG: phosphoglycerate dehydrogenase [Phycisphaeraceae bacterium]|nr:phosphoglycerate dehydrogenase [Phycisphaeraceae bacterium]MCW5754403.1 phosphoglycerate dehydrogenase [Phycisphaeraceae bacterium]
MQAMPTEHPVQEGPATSFPKERIRVVLLEGVHARAADLLREEGFHVETHAGALEGKALAEAVGRAHVLGIRSKTRVTEEVLQGAPRLLAVGCFCIGTDQVDLAAARRRGVAVFNSPFGNTRSVAELTIAEVVCLFRRVIEKSAGLHAGRWDKSASGAHEVRGRTLGIVGYGHIGSQVSVLAEALGMRVLYFDVMPKLPLGNARACRTLEELLEKSDVVTVHVPDSPGTKGLLGRSELARMPRGSFVINNARGSVVDLEALAASVREGHLGGAAVDVFPVEPARNDEGFACVLRGLPNVILTPHIGGSTVEAQASIGEDVAGKLTRFVNVGATTGAVNVPEVDLPAQPGHPGRKHRILHFHRNVPGVLSRLHGLIAEMGANVSAEVLGTREDVGYAVLEVDPTDGARLAEAMKRVPETIRVRTLW